MKIQNRSTEAHDRSPKSKIENGFTLIEVTIAITLLALIAMTLYGAFYLGHRAVEKSQARSDESQKIRSREDLLAGYIRSAYPFRFSRQTPEIYFSGQENRLEFVSALSSGMGGRGMSRITISWEGGENGNGFLTLAEEIPLRLEGQGEGEGYKNSIVLGQGIREFRMNYLDLQGGEENWVDQWDGKERKALPRAVRLSHQGEKGEEIQQVFPIMMSVLTP